MVSCVNTQLQQNGETVPSLVARGMMANDPQVQPFISQCRQIEAVSKAWRAMNARTKSCVGNLLQANNQSVQVLAEMGVGPSDSQVSPLVAKCQQIAAVAGAWRKMDGDTKSCVGASPPSE